MLIYERWTNNTTATRALARNSRYWASRYKVQWIQPYRERTILDNVQFSHWQSHEKQRPRKKSSSVVWIVKKERTEQMVWARYVETQDLRLWHHVIPLYFPIKEKSKWVNNNPSNTIPLLLFELCPPRWCSDAPGTWKMQAYLSAAEFKEKFGVAKDAFYKLPKWKQNKLKMALQLFWSFPFHAFVHSLFFHSACYCTLANM